MKKSNRIIAGAMSGTSADGVDVAVISVAGHGLEMSAELLHHHQLAYDPSIREQIFSARNSGIIGLDKLAKLGKAISHTYARAVNEALAAAKIEAGEVEAIAAHGQTLFHDPPHTIQWLDPALVAAETGCAVVSDFRRADCAAGGQGAPLVPFADYILFRHPTKNRVLLNIGGIANLTWLKAGGLIEDVIAFDTGPGNCISDHLCRMHQPDGPGYDVDGALASKGILHDRTAFEFARSQYVSKKPPKSTDGPAMLDLFKKTKAISGFSGTFEDELATSCGCSAFAISKSLELGAQWWSGVPQEILISGGGLNNQYLMKLIRESCANRKLEIIEMDKTLAQAKEAIAFALLGAATLDGLPSNIPSVTGAKRAVILGSITPKP